MLSEDFAKQIKIAQARALDLQRESLPSRVDGDSLDTAIAELIIALEELRVQNEELVATQLMAEKERQRYLDFFEFAPDPYLTTTREGVICEANNAACERLGVSRSFLLGKLLVTFIDGAERRKFRMWLSHLCHKKWTDLEEIETVLRPRHALRFRASVRVAATQDENGNPINLLWLIRDVTEHKQNEQGVQRWDAELEHRVQERTDQLEAANRMKDERLARAEEARAYAEAANRAKDEFLATISHEIRTPLNSIVGWVYILKQRIGDEQIAAQAFDIIERNAMTQARIIKDILDISRVVSDKLVLALEPLDMSWVIEKAVEALRPAADLKSIRLQTYIEPFVGVIEGDGTRLQQVVSNLLSNAIKFTPEHGSIEIRLDSLGDHAQVTVADTGKGISPEALPYIFDRFWQADSSSSRSHGGLGLGLALVRHIVGQHGGEVHARSEGEGKGATFVFTVPLAKEYQPSLIEPAHFEMLDVQEGSAGKNNLEGLSVVVVDDEPDAREMLRVVFERCGATVCVAGSCGEALEAIKGAKGGLPDVLVADIAMPGEDGYDLIRRVRALGQDQGGAIPALALTAYASAEDRLRVLKEGYQIHLPKPVPLNDLVAAIGSLAGRGASHRAYKA